MSTTRVNINDTLHHKVYNIIYCILLRNFFEQILSVPYSPNKYSKTEANLTILELTLFLTIIIAAVAMIQCDPMVHMV